LRKVVLRVPSRDKIRSELEQTRRVLNEIGEVRFDWTRYLMFEEFVNYLARAEKNTDDIIFEVQYDDFVEEYTWDEMYSAVRIMRLVP